MTITKTPLYQVDAFASKPFTGNPAAICPLEQWLPTQTMQLMAMENNLAETAFFVKRPDGGYHLRWFTPTTEVDLCGHATLASAHVLFKHLGFDKNAINFHTHSGVLIVSKQNNHYLMDFPADTPQIAILEQKAANQLFKGLGILPTEVYKGVSDLLIEVENQEVLASLKPYMEQLGAVPSRGVIVTAKGDSHDFVSRFFAPQSGIDEDPVTGSAHTTLTPYWAAKLGKNKLTARQISARGGELLCELQGDRVTITGEAVTVLEGYFLL